MNLLSILVTNNPIRNGQQYTLEDGITVEPSTDQDHYTQIDSRIKSCIICLLCCILIVIIIAVIISLKK